MDAVAYEMGDTVINDRDAFLKTVWDTAKAAGARLSAPELKAIVAAVGERDPNATICTDKNSDPESDPELSDTETVPLNEAIDHYMAREVLPHVADAWVNHSKTKIGYEIPFNRHFYVLEPLRPLNEIEGDLQSLEREIAGLLAVITAAEGAGPSTRPKRSEVEWLGAVPGHWQVNRLEHVASYRTSSVDKKTKDQELPVRLCNYTDVYYQERIRASQGDFMEASATPQEIAKFKLNVGDVVITKDSEDWTDIAVPALIEEVADDFVCGYHLGIIRPDLRIDPTFAFRAMQSLAVNRQLQVSASGVTRYGVPNPAVGEVLIPVPPLQEQRAIAGFLDRQTARIDKMTSLAEAAIERLQEYRTALITAAVTGKIDVRESGPVETGSSAT